MIAWREPQPAICKVEKCYRTSYSSGYCSGHYSRLTAKGDVLAEVPLRPKKVDVSSPVANYEAAHYRVRRVKGHARQYVCHAGCGYQAQSWAYMGNAPDDRHTEGKGHFSSDPNYYLAFCDKCHNGMDAKRRTEELVASKITNG